MEKVDMEYIKGVVESEGLEYAVCNYLGADRIEDGELAILWSAAKGAMGAVEKYLKDNGGWPDWD